MPITETAIRTALARVIEPDLKKDIVELDLVREVVVDENTVHVTVEVSNPALHSRKRMEEAVSFQLKKELGNDVQVRVTVNALSGDRANVRKVLPKVKHIIAIASGKGGVGKSTITANLAAGLAQRGFSVGLVDADIYGPSMPIMMGLSGRPEGLDGKTMEPLTNHGVQVISIGFLVDPDQATIWRGPMATQALDQLLRQTHWKELDYLIVDLPPGTGDIQLSLSQRVPLTGAVIVTTPQDIALADARKGVAMFEKVGVPILGLVENMAVHVCSNCGHVEHIFGADGGKRYAADKGIEYLGALPLALEIREQADSGRPSVVADPDGQVATSYKAIARQVAIRIADRAKDYSSKFPSITISRSS